MKKWKHLGFIGLLYCINLFAVDVSFVAGRVMPYGRKQTRFFGAPMTVRPLNYGFFLHNKMFRYLEFQWGGLWDVTRGYQNSEEIVSYNGPLALFFFKGYPYRILSFGLGAYTFFELENFWVNYGLLMSLGLQFPVLRVFALTFDLIGLHSAQQKNNVYLVDLLLLAGIRLSL